MVKIHAKLGLAERCAKNAKTARCKFYEKSIISAFHHFFNVLSLIFPSMLKLATPSSTFFTERRLGIFQDGG